MCKGSKFAVAPPSQRSLTSRTRRLVTAQRITGFVAQVAHLYPEDAAALPESLVSLMDGHYAVLDANLRRTLFQSLVLLRNRGRMAPQRLIGLAFRLFRCQDKVLRSMLYNHIVTDVRNINKASAASAATTPIDSVSGVKETEAASMRTTPLSFARTHAVFYSPSSQVSNNQRLNREVQRQVFSMLEDANATAAKQSLRVMVDLYRRRVWVDARTVNMIASACFGQPRITLHTNRRAPSTIAEPP